MDLDDLLNSALDELETQEKEKKPKLTTTTTTTTTTAANNSSNNNSNVKNVNTQTNTSNSNNDLNFENIFSGLNGGDFDLGKLSQQFTDLLKSPEFSDLMNQDNNNNLPKQPSTGDQMFPNNKELEDLKNNMNMDDMTEEEQKEFKEAYDKITMLMKDVNNAFGDLNSSNNNNSNNNNQQQQPNININDFENSVSETLKGLANNASKQSTQGDDLSNLFSMFSQSAGEEGGDQMDEFFEESLKYISENYPSWIENNKDKYSEDDIKRFRKQSELFKELMKQGDDSQQANLLNSMTELGNLPERFCDEYLSKLESQFAGGPK